MKEQQFTEDQIMQILKQAKGEFLWLIYAESMNK